MTTIVSKIKSAPLERFKNAKHIAFTKQVVNSFTLFPYISEIFPRYTALVSECYEKEDELYQRVERPLLIKEKNSDNNQRVNDFYFIRSACRTALRSNNRAMVSAAETVLAVSDKYGGSQLQRFSQGDRTGMITNFVDDLQMKFQAEIETLNLQTAVSNLAASNDKFLSTNTKLLEDASIYGDQKLAAARSDTDKALRLLFNEVNNAAVTGSFPQLRPFINYTNAAIDENSFGLGNNSSSTTKPVVPDEGTETVKTFHYITFMNGGRQVARFRCEVGKPIPEEKIPAAPEGKKWDSIPELMPDEPVTVNAVPIGSSETTTPQEFTPEELRAFPVLPALYGSVEEITNPNSLISPFNPLSQNYKLSNLLPGTPAPTDGEVPEGKSKVKFEREEEEAETRRIRREMRRLLHSELSEDSEGSEESEDTALLDTKPFYVWYDTGLPIQSQGYLPPLLPGFHWYDIEHVLDSEHYTVRAVRNTSPDEGEQEDDDLTAGMLWPADRPAPDGWCVVTFRPAHGEPITKLYRQGATIVSQGFLPENEEGYIWSGIYSKLNSSTHTAEEVEE